MTGRAQRKVTPVMRSCVDVSDAGNQCAWVRVLWCCDMCTLAVAAQIESRGAADDDDGWGSQ